MVLIFFGFFHPFLKILYARLKVFKSISVGLAQKDESSAKGKGNGNGAASTRDPKHHYEILLGQCEALFTNELEQHVFEDQTRAVFGYKVSLLLPFC